MKNIIYLIILLFTANTHAGLITLNESQAYTTEGQSFSFSFDGSDGLVQPGSGQSSKVLIELFNIDLSFSQTFENFTYNIESISSGGPIAGEDLDSISSTTTIGSIDGSFSFELSSLELSQILSDLTFNLDLDFTNNVGPQNQLPAFVEVTLTYEDSVVQSVPEPASLVLLGLGLAGLGFSRRKDRA